MKSRSTREPAAAARKPGRPRSAEVDHAILKATLTALAEDGFGGMSIEGVAARAGVGKTTIYRRWRSKGELVTAALQQMDADVHVPDTGSTRQDLALLLTDFKRVTLGTLAGTMMSRVMSAAVTNPELMEILWRNMVNRRRTAIETILRRGQERGEIRVDLNIQMATDIAAGGAILRILFAPVYATNLETLPTDIVDSLWSGLSSSPE